MAIIKPFIYGLPQGIRRVDGVFCEEHSSHVEFTVNLAFRPLTFSFPEKILTGNAITHE